jgi:hypothetical protein
MQEYLPRNGPSKEILKEGDGDSLEEEGKK